MSEPQEQRWHRLHDHVVHGLRGAGHCTSPMRTTSTRPGPMCHVLATRASPVAYVARSRVRGWIERVEFRSGAVAGRPPGGSEGLLSSSAQSGDPGPARRGCAGRVPGTRIRNTGRAKTGPRDATRFPQIRRPRRVASVHRYVGSTSSIQIRHCSSPVKEANTPRWNVPLKNQNFARQNYRAARAPANAGSSTADSNACLYDRPHRRHRLSIIRSPYRLPPRGSCHRSSA